MIIPPQLQVFDRTVVLSDKDAERLAPHLAYWDKLHRLLALGVNEPDLQRLIILELMGAKRNLILIRLMMRLGKVQRKEIERRVYRLLK